MGQTIVEKIAQAHMAEGPARALRAGDFLAIRPHHIMTHDNTSAVMKKFKGLGVRKVYDATQPVFALDHDIQNQAPENLSKYSSIEAFAREHGIDFYPAGTGIGHQIMIEQGYVVPGSFVVASDSHSNMYGSVGAIGSPVVRTDAAAVWATGDFWWQIPRTVQVVLNGRLAHGATGKDLIITLCGLYGDEVLNAAVEFTGPGVASLSADERMTISNMSTEWGVLTGWFPCDATTIAYFRKRHAALKARGVERFTEADIASWETNAPVPDADAPYAARIELDLASVTPHVSGPDTVQLIQPLSAIAPKQIRIAKAYLLSCVNSRLEDLELAASALRGKKVADGVTMYVAAASHEVQDEAERRGIWSAIVDAGAKPLPPSCGPCIGLGTGLLEPGEVGISATNRNFKGRMGSRDAQCYLANPAVVAASAVAGYITSPSALETIAPAHRFEVLALPAAASEKVEILSGFPERLVGRVVYVPADNLNTDGIYGKDYTYREDVTREEMARVVMQNYDPDFALRAKEGDVVVSGFNFGTGSSREQAVTALQAKGIPLVIASSFSQTYLRNAFNNGFLCIECPELSAAMRKASATSIAAGERTIIPDGTMEIDFTTGTIVWKDARFHFPALGSVPQSLVVAGGVENLVRQRLGLA